MNVMTGAVAIVKYRGKAIGYMRNISANESFSRTNTYQLGSAIPFESPMTQWSGSGSCGFIFINIKISGLPQAVIRNVQNNTEFENNLVLDSDGIQLDVYKKEADVIDPDTKKISPKTTPSFTIRRAFITSDNLTVNEGAVSGRDQSFNFIDPIIQPE